MPFRGARWWRVAVTLAPGPVVGQAPPLSPAMQEAVRAHVLTEANSEPVVGVLRELSASMVADPDIAKRLLGWSRLAPEQQVEALAADPLSARVLKGAGLSSRDYVVGLLALRAAAGAPAGSPLADAASPANAAFLREHPNLLERFRAAERGQWPGSVWRFGAPWNP